MVRKMFTELAGTSQLLTESIFIQTSPNIWIWYSRESSRGCKLTVGATVQPPFISPCLVPEAWIKLLDRTVKREKE